MNHEGLVEGRRDIYRRTALLINEIEELSTSQLAKHSMARHQVIKAKLLELISMAGKFSEYSAAVKCCLRESGHDWAISIAISA
ncbi:MAG: hypothetical protein IPO05_13540 [Flavobacteriales bacterium]|nr:hypothetical protein [Flavobacteriales bacterium]